MTRRATFTQAEVERVLRASKKTGVPVEWDPVTGVVRALTPKPETEQMTDLQRWRAARDARRTNARS